MIAEFKECQRTRIAQHEAATQAKHAEKAAAAAQTVAEARKLLLQTVWLLLGWK